MPSLKPEKIDSNSEYPCPCGRKGTLLPITLTEAFGCDRCHQIFAVEEDGYSLDQLSSHYPNKRSWRWIGDRWQLARAKTDSLPLLMGVSTAVAIIALSTIFSTSGIMKLLLLGGMILLVGSVLIKIAWLIWRR